MQEKEKRGVFFTGRQEVLNIHARQVTRGLLFLEFVAVDLSSSDLIRFNFPINE